ncbi:hypothetical protein E2C01_067693 [Portunus trituberculatus]|uniref:Uncharacterized protein n=1 Tax=Portunus trituberculatus TaxID=210409 RepID=A0A5B7HUG4_PORTR|nr:hypothetical protein [Portunus trituberculatus]
MMALILKHFSAAPSTISLLYIFILIFLIRTPLPSHPIPLPHHFPLPTTIHYIFLSPYVQCLQQHRSVTQHPPPSRSIVVTLAGKQEGVIQCLSRHVQADAIGMGVLDKLLSVTDG